MKVHIITIFPESFESYFWSSIMKKAISWWFFEPVFYKLNDFSTKNTKRVDDKAYWMHGQVISPEPLSKAINHIFDKVWKSLPVVYMTPSWSLLNQEMSEKMSQNLDEFVIICWHYEGIDGRIIEKYVTHEISIWEYVLSSGEISSMVFLDSLVRLLPWVLWSDISHEEDSFSLKLNRQKEYPVYTRPEIFEWMEVPNVLLSWNPKKIDEWKNNNLK